MKAGSEVVVADISLSDERLTLPLTERAVAHDQNLHE
jgi:hypothetical protein